MKEAVSLKASLEPAGSLSASRFRLNETTEPEVTVCVTMPEEASARSTVSNPVRKCKGKEGGG